MAQPLPETNNPLHHLKAIIFDLDGVIADTEDLHRQAYNKAFKEAGVNTCWSYQDYRDRLIKTAGSKLDEILPPDPQLDRVEFRKRLYTAKRSHYVKMLDEANLEPRPGVLRLIHEALAQGVNLAAASTCSREGAFAILDRVLGPELRKQFSAIRAGDDAKNRKPAPDIYLLALEAIGLPATACVAIEDTLHGLESAHGAGLCTLVTPSQYTIGDDFSHAECVVKDLEAGGVNLQMLDHILGTTSSPMASRLDTLASLVLDDRSLSDCVAIVSKGTEESGGIPS
jgi:HAD superfamily hydrolase (TIGR01509 family)